MISKKVKLSVANDFEHTQMSDKTARNINIIRNILF